jgi:predicted phosphodiesterase
MKSVTERMSVDETPIQTLNGTIKYWVFGHTHDPIEYEIDNVKFLCNPLGYPNESGYGENITMKNFEI